MKKIAAFITLVLLTVGLSAQRFEGGIAGGLNLTQLDGDMLSGYNKVGLNGGFWIKYPFTDKWSAGLDFLYMQKGAVRTIDENNIAATHAFDKFRVHYVEIPLYAGYTWKKFTGQAGLTGAYLFNAKTEDFTGIRDYKDKLKPFETGVLLGAAYQINEQLSIQLRWQYSIVSIAEGDSRTIFTDNGFSRRIVGLYNNLLSVSLKYAFK